MAHTLQLAIEDGLKEENEMLERARKVIKKLRTPKYKNLLKAHKVTKRALIDHSVRWSSKYSMLKRFLVFEEFCKTMSEAYPSLIFEPWAHIKKMVETLEPLAITTKILQTQQLTPTDAFFAWFSCETQLSQFQIGMYNWYL